ncbi:MAG: hypothetical protein JW974_03485 [Alphaproteobacteria bacterium]|nr:hypothetical protein [Alphaproteobacteria bacterium]MBN2675301.1 hypothetical protein [Alphaproteobacteria bacterium]
MKFTGYGSAGVIELDFENPVFVGDWLVRSQINYAVAANNTIGLVYAIDELAIYQDNAARDSFIFMENTNLGRIELGLTDSIATKLGVGLPDVGGLRINDNPLFYNKIKPSGAIISNTTLSSGRYDMRANFVSTPTRPVQYGFSIAGLSSKYNYAADLGIKYRRPEGKTKTAFSFGASFIDSPENFQTDIYTPSVTADWRAQLSTGLNLQYNSWVWGLSGRIIYDENSIGMVSSDGVIAGTGISYDLLNYTISGTYLFSQTGIWDDMPNYTAHTQVLSFRYKYSENVNGWISTGFSAGSPFVSAGLKLNF